MTEKQAWERYFDLKKKISAATAPVKDESPEAKEKRIKRLLDDPVAFCKYYFPQFFDPAQGGAEFAWFQKKLLKDISAFDDFFGVFEAPREHAKSVLCDIFIPLLLKAKGELTGLVICSHNKKNACGLISDLQAQLESNRRYIDDFGQQFNYGSWAEGHFITRDGVGFWAIGKGESPRGLREAEKRPNTLIIDDFDEDEEVLSETRVDKSLRWLKGALMGAIAIKRRRIIMTGNRIHKRSALAKIVGDVEDDDIKNEGVYHLKVFALENPKTHKEDQSETGVPAWNRYTRADLQKVFDQIGYVMTQREFFHRHIEQGTVFKTDWIRFEKTPKSLKDFNIIVTYNDPSFKDSKKNDYKAIIAVGKSGRHWWLLDVWVRQATRKAMVQAHYDMGKRLELRNPQRLIHYIEANFTQDQLLEDYVNESVERGYMLPIKQDLRQKPNKQGRIENMMVYWERNLVIVDEELAKSRDWQNFKDQMVAFPQGHDDGPDAFEGAVFKVNEHVRVEAPMSLGNKRRNNLM